MEQYFICPRCHKKVTVSTNKLPFTTDAKEKGAEINFIKPLFSVVCDRCQEDMFECDKEMVYPVIGLNQKGYDTHACCAGHHKSVNPENLSINDRYSIPYVVFTPNNVYISSFNAFKQAYKTCTDLAKDFERISVEISEDFVISDNGKKLESIYIYANSKESHSGFLTTAKWIKAKQEFFEYIDKLIEVLPDIS